MDSGWWREDAQNTIGIGEWRSVLLYSCSRKYPTDKVNKHFAINGTTGYRMKQKQTKLLLLFSSVIYDHDEVDELSPCSSVFAASYGIFKLLYSVVRRLS